MPLTARWVGKLLYGAGKDCTLDVGFFIVVYFVIINHSHVEGLLQHISHQEWSPSHQAIND